MTSCLGLLQSCGTVVNLVAELPPNSSGCAKLGKAVNMLRSALRELAAQPNAEGKSKQILLEVSALLQTISSFLHSATNLLRLGVVDGLDVTVGQLVQKLSIAANAIKDAVKREEEERTKVIILFGDYDVARLLMERTCHDAGSTLIAQGQFGVTFRANVPASGDTYVVTTLHLALIARNAVNMTTLLEECRAQQKLDHRNIARYLSVFQANPESDIHIAMEYIEGETLADKIDQSKAPTEVELIKWTGQMAAALSYLHSKGMQHRDLKPEDVKITGDGDIKLVGMKLPCLTSRNDTVSVYASYERASGQPYDDRDDVWALGCILSELLTRCRNRYAQLNHPAEEQRRQDLIDSASNGSLYLGGQILPYLLRPLQAHRYTAQQLLEKLSGPSQSESPQKRKVNAVVVDDRGVVMAGGGKRAALPVVGSSEVSSTTAISVASELQAVQQKPLLSNHVVPSASSRCLATVPALLPAPASQAGVYSAPSPSVSALFAPTVAPTPTSATQSPPQWLGSAAANSTASPLTHSGRAHGAPANVAAVDGATIPSDDLVELVSSMVKNNVSSMSVAEVIDSLAKAKRRRESASVNGVSIAPALASAAARVQSRPATDGGSSSRIAAAARSAAAQDQNSVLSALVGSLTHNPNPTLSARDAAVKQLEALCDDSASTVERMAELGGVRLWLELLCQGSEAAQCLAAKALHTLISKDRTILPVVAASGAIASLVQMLRQASESGKVAAVAVLARIVHSGEGHAEAVAAAGAIEPMVRLLSDGAGNAKQNAAAALWNLAMSTQHRAAMVRAGAIPLLMQLLKEGTVTDKGYAAGALKQLATDLDSRDKIARAGALPLMEGLLTEPDERCQEQAAVALRMLVYNPWTGSLWAKRTTVPALARVMKEGTKKASEHAAAALRLVAVHGFTGNDVPPEILEVAVRPLVQQLREGSSVARMSAAKELATLTDTAPNRDAIARAEAIPALVELLQTGIALETAEQAATTLMALAVGKDRRDRMVNAGVIEPLVLMLRNGRPQGQEVSAGLIKCLSASPDAASVIGAAGAIPPLVSLLTQGTDWAKAHASGALANLARRPEFIRPIADTGVIPRLVQLLRLQYGLGARGNAIRTLMHLGVDPTLRRMIVSLGATAEMSALLRGGSLSGSREEKRRLIPAALAVLERGA